MLCISTAGQYYIQPSLLQPPPIPPSLSFLSPPILPPPPSEVPSIPHIYTYMYYTHAYFLHVRAIPDSSLKHLYSGAAIKKDMIHHKLSCSTKLTIISHYLWDRQIIDAPSAIYCAVEGDMHIIKHLVHQLRLQ